MAFLEFSNIEIKGFSAAVPKEIEENAEYPFFHGDEAEKFMKSTGVERKRGSRTLTFSDLCMPAANKLITDLKWNKSEIDALIIVTQSQDYKLPATSCILQNKLELSEECYTLDISLGCSGWVYALSVVSGLIGANKIRKAILLAGDTNRGGFKDKSAYPLFGDVATATALEYTERASKLYFHVATDGNGYQSIIIPDGGERNPINQESLVEQEIGPGIIRYRTKVRLEGMDIFSFGISKPPTSVNKLLEKFKIEKDQIDYFTFHQANKFMNEKIRKKLHIPEDRYLYSLKDFGNTSSASIPLTLLTQISDKLESEYLKHVACGFGVGLSWGSVYFTTEKIKCCKLIEI